MTKIISILSPCSEVGKTIISINLAAALSKKNMKIMLIDANKDYEIIKWNSKRLNHLFCTAAIPRYEILPCITHFTTQFDYIIVDGSIHEHCFNYTQLSNYILIPILPCSFTISKTSELIDALSSSPNKVKSNFVFNRCIKGQPIDAALIGQLKEYKIEPLNARLNENPLIKESYKQGDSIYCKGESVPVSEFNSIVEEIITRM